MKQPEFAQKYTSFFMRIRRERPNAALKKRKLLKICSGRFLRATHTNVSKHPKRF